MKKLMTIALGLGLVLGLTTFAQEKAAPKTEAKAKPTKAKPTKAPKPTKAKSTAKM